jgi:hypothetical protein
MAVVRATRRDVVGGRPKTPEEMRRGSVRPLHVCFACVRFARSAPRDETRASAPPLTKLV